MQYTSEELSPPPCFVSSSVLLYLEVNANLAGIFMQWFEKEFPLVLINVYRLKNQVVLV